ncbi:MAG: TatD family hydrolase [Deltaproteobacteria bacterium]|nr:TatD family hydrolase [Deltaproteobacteria bacterium]
MTATPALFDSHCHLDFVAFDADRDLVLDRARAAGVVGMVVAAVHPRDWARAGALAAAHDDVFAAVGVHPEVLPGLTAASLGDALGALVAEAGVHRAVAIGETGFDSRVTSEGVSLEAQGRAVDAHRHAARALGLPVILHIVGAHGPALEHLERGGPFPHGGVVHSYSGSAELVDRYVALNLHLGFAGAVVRPKARKPRAAAARVPAGRLLVETDAPDQPLSGAVSTRNEPSAVARVAEAVAAARGEAFETVARFTTENARVLYRLP